MHKDVVALIALLLATTVYCRLQTATVKGQIACMDKTVSNVLIELREADTC